MNLVVWPTVLATQEAEAGGSSFKACLGQSEFKSSLGSLVKLFLEVKWKEGSNVAHGRVSYLNEALGQSPVAAKREEENHRG